MRRATLSLLLCAAPAAADDFAPRLDTSHFGYYEKGRRVGTFDDALSVRGTGADAQFLYTCEMNTRNHRDAIPGPTQITIRAEFDGNSPFALRHGTYIELGRVAVRTVAVVRTATGYDTVVTQSGFTHRFTSAVARYTLRDLCHDESWLNHDPPAGATLAATELVWSEARTALLNHRSRGRVGATFEFETTGDHGLMTVTRINATTREVIGITFPNGAEYRAERPEPGRPLDEPEPPPTGMVPTDQPLGPGPHSWLRLTLRGYSGTGLVSGARQTVERRSEVEWECRLGQGEGDRLSVTDEDARAALVETPRVPFGHPKVMELARKAVGSARTQAEKVERLVHFVHDYIQYQVSETPELFELLGTKRGNCQSYALLFVALARAEGLPAREVDGFTYAGDEARGFGAHRWVEVARDGLWYAVDPTADLTELDATYLRLDGWADGMTLTVDEVAWTGGLRGLSVRGVARWVAERPGMWVAIALIVVVVVVRSRRLLRAGAHRDVTPEPAP